MRIITLILLLALTFPVSNSFSGILGILPETDTAGIVLIAPFDLRDRESFFQVTNLASSNQTVHIQIYNVANLCNENNFFDVYTPNDTHIYNLRDILTNDSNPSGVVLPDDAYGIIIAAVPIEDMENFAPLFGNIRITDNLGYEYRTNAITNPTDFALLQAGIPNLTFNFNSENGVVLSDIFGIALSLEGNDAFFEFTLDNVLETWVAVDVDIINNNEVLFSCRDVVFSCVDENSPLLEEILVLASEGNIVARSSASVARYEYGINDVIPNSKGGELLCPGNNIPEGEVILTFESAGQNFPSFVGFAGLNNGNGRGSLDSFIQTNTSSSILNQ